MQEPEKSFGPSASRKAPLRRVAIRAALVAVTALMGASATGCASASGPRLGEPLASPVATADAIAESRATGDAASASVTIYGADWCGPCHQAAAFLSKRGIHFVERNIGEDEGAQREMKAKLERAGLRAGTIPIIDVKGMILVGFSPHAVDRALRRPRSL